MKITAARIITSLLFTLLVLAVSPNSHAATFDFSTTIAVEVPNKTVANPTFVVGSTVTYALTARNTGNAPANVSLTVQFAAGFKQPQGTGGSFSCSTSGTTLSCQSTSPLTPNTPRTITVTVSAPATVTGNSQSFPVTATMDPTNAVPETNEGNNQSTTTTIVVPKGPDLTIDLTGSDATAVGLGEVKYKVQIKNIGDRATSASPTLVATFPSAVHYLRVENSQFGGCNYGNGTIHCGVGNSLAAGATESAQFVAKVDQNVAQNTHISFTATADPTNAIQEFVENNNNASFTTTLTEIADLFVTGVTHVKFQCDKNGDFVPETTYHTITANVRNTGHTSAGATKVMMEIVGGFNSEAIDCGTHKQMVSCNGCSGAIASICTSTSAGATCDINPLAPNGTQQLLITVEDDEDVSAGAYTAKFIVDPGNSILESNENNNQTNHTVD